ncbi:hypothetical protein P5G62_027435 [Neobacillus sp. 179-C4.2 HS]|uniref:Uncharacterized protein n=1 Tax=Neobacillus driksii TaxID=3035913 RepID=A0ABV4Z170_9BACI|nr:hypothetical protein [Neobacillus sp. 179.-C4.2 HS]MDP5197695.1 hypothetical protein [Neobacillus sp. 179.-C4.2 HS]
MEYQIMLYGGMAGTIITLIISIILYIKMGIAQVVEDLTGISLRKRLHKKKKVQDESNEQRLTKEIMLKKQYAGEAAASQETELMSSEIDETAILGDGDIEETSLLTADFDETTLLSEGVEETSLLLEEDFFKKEVDVIVVHSTTII